MAQSNKDDQLNSMTTSQRTTQQEIIEGLQRLGVKPGDVLFLRADLGAFGKTDFPLSRNLIDLLLEAVGEDGTIATLTFTPVYRLEDVRPEQAFTAQTPSTSGALAKLFLKDKRVVRSAHPSTSFAAIGKRAEYICADHNADAPPYLPVKKFIELDALMALTGCVENSPGFTTVHWNQDVLGYAEQSYLSGVNGVYYSDGDTLKLHTITRPGGCSKGFGKFYTDYDNADALSTTSIGNAYSIAVRAARGAEIEYDRMKDDPKYALCDNPDCYKCRATWKFNKAERHLYFLRQYWATIKNLVHKS